MELTFDKAEVNSSKLLNLFDIEDNSNTAWRYKIVKIKVVGIYENSMLQNVTRMFSGI
jgi:hypothetical protein